MPQPKAEWIRRLKEIDSQADLRWNASVGRWEFLLTCADGVVRSQFWCDFTGPRDPVTGMTPYRELNDEQFNLAIKNLTESFVGNRYDGEGSPYQRAMQRYLHNRNLRNQKFKEAGNLFADVMWDGRHRIFGDAVVGWTPETDSAPQGTWKFRERRAAAGVA